MDGIITLPPERTNGKIRKPLTEEEQRRIDEEVKAAIIEAAKDKDDKAAQIIYDAAKKHGLI